MEALLIDDDVHNHDGMTTSLAYRNITLRPCPTLAEALAYLAEHTPHIIILDLVMPDPETGIRDYYKPLGIRVARQVSQQYPHLPLLIYSNHVQHLPELEAILNQHGAGASYLHRGDGPDELARYIRETVAGAKWISSDVSRMTLASSNHHGRSSPNFPPEQLEQLKKFTPRELETCKHAADGLSNPEIAQRMGVTVHAVDRHFHNMYKKLEVNREGNGEKSAVNPRTLLLSLYHHLCDRDELPPH